MSYTKSLALSSNGPGVEAWTTSWVETNCENITLHHLCPDDSRETGAFDVQPGYLTLVFPQDGIKLAMRYRRVP